MRKLAVVAFLILSLMAGAIGFAQAQTPEAQDAEDDPFLRPIPGASLEIMHADASESGVVGMTLYRITLTPGTEIPEHDHSGAVTWYVDSGTLGLTVISGEVWVRCAAECVPDATPDAAGFVLVSEGDEVMLEAGDWMIQHGTVAHAYRNAGEGDEAGNVVINASTTYLNLVRSCAGGCY